MNAKLLSRHFVLECDGESRLDTALHLLLCELPEAEFAEMFGEDFALSRSRVERLIRDGHVRIGDRPVVRPGQTVRGGEEITVEIPECEPMDLEPEKFPIDILFEDSDVLVINKPPGLTVHPGAGIHSGTLVNGLLGYLGENLRAIGDKLRPGIVHRLDRDTSGVMIVAKTSAAHASLCSQFLPPRAISRVYHALTFHIPGQGMVKNGTIDIPIGRDRSDRTKISIRSSNARDAVTHWKLIEKFSDAYLLEVRLETGRTHQIRVHLQHAKSPILGDPVYGPPEGQLPRLLREAVAGFTRQALHAYELSFAHPRSGEVHRISAPYPEDFSGILTRLRALTS